MWSAICFNLDHSKILSSGNGLTDKQNVTEGGLVKELFHSRARVRLTFNGYKKM